MSERTEARGTEQSKPGGGDRKGGLSWLDGAEEEGIAAPVRTLAFTGHEMGSLQRIISAALRINSRRMRMKQRDQWEMMHCLRPQRSEPQRGEKGTGRAFSQS